MISDIEGKAINWKSACGFKTQTGYLFILNETSN